MVTHDITLWLPQTQRKLPLKREPDGLPPSIREEAEIEDMVFVVSHGGGLAAPLIRLVAGRHGGSMEAVTRVCYGLIAEIVLDVSRGREHRTHDKGAEDVPPARARGRD